MSQDAGWAKGINRSPCRAGLGVGHPDYSGGLVAVQCAGYLSKAYVSFCKVSVLGMRFDHQAEGGKLAFANMWRLGGIKGRKGKNRL